MCWLKQCHQKPRFFAVPVYDLDLRLLPQDDKIANGDIKPDVTVTSRRFFQFLFFLILIRVLKSAHFVSLYVEFGETKQL